MQTYSKEEAREHVSGLVESFQKVEATLDEAQESQIENDYIRPLFRYLNWRTESAGLRMSEREMVLVETDRQGKRPDYRFQLNGQHLFFVDAKKVKYRMHDPRWQWQVYRYAYSTRNNPAPRKVDFGVLTDFQEFILLDCTFEARKPEAVNNFRVLDWRYTDYVTQFDRLWDIFERKNVLEASGDRKSGLWACYLSPKQAKANRVAPDEGFLDKLDNDKNGWRVRLAKDMKKCSPNLTGEVITAAVQLLIDRLVFIKALSDRDIDDDYLAKLAECIETNGLGEDDRGWFSAAKPVFDRLNRFYDGSIFKSQTEETVITSNRVVRDIIRELDPDNSPYDLSVLPVEILGTIYERFLGKVVRTTEQRVKIEDKPEVRKAGGVYYTPQYIVHYIVEQTVGKLLADCKTPDDVAKLKILDPACGSGSFLIGASDALIEWHKSYYTAKAKPARDAAYRDADGDIRLTAKLKRQILLNNIFGVDIDQQAVEVTRFSLSLKALEDTRKDELDEERNLFNETVLPDLKDNIVCGNSLIGTDILEGHLFVPEEERKLNPMNFEDKFPEIMGCGGFDVVIGNPPYVFGEFINKSQKDYYTAHYRVAKGQYDLYHLFYERALSLTRARGYHGYIILDAVLARDETMRIRSVLLKENGVSSIYHAGTVFQNVGVSAVVIISQRGMQSGDGSASLHQVTENGAVVSERKLVLSRFTRDPKMVLAIDVDDDEASVLQKTRAQEGRLNDWCEFSRGEELGKRHFQRQSRLKHGFAWILVGEDVQRYFVDKPNFQIRKSELVKDADLYKAPKLVIVKTGARPIAALEGGGVVTMQSLYNGQFNELHSVRPEFLLAIVNSVLIAWYLRKTVTAYKKMFPQFNQNHFEQLPVPQIDLLNAADKARHDNLVGLVEQMLAAKKAWAAAQTEKDKTYYDDKCKALDKQIDTLVYELYGLTAEEIAIVEDKR